MGQRGRSVTPFCARVGLDALDLGDGRVQGAGHELVHPLRVVAFDEIGRVAVAPEEMIQLLVLMRASTVGFAIL